jgi:uncharacterized protein (TIGR00369 family)
MQNVRGSARVRERSREDVLSRRAMSAPTIRMTADELLAFLARAFPHSDSSRFAIDALDARSLVLRRQIREDDKRPGGTVKGPTLMALADTVAYLLVLARLGLEGEGAVTTNLTMNFLRRPRFDELVSEGRILKIGKRLAVIDVHIRSLGDEEPSAQATVTYALPSS